MAATAAARPNIYQAVIEKTTVYLGPASERFIERQVRTHVKKDPTELEKKDLEPLVEWVEVSMGLLTDDKKSIEELANSLRKLAKEK